MAKIGLYTYCWNNDKSLQSKFLAELAKLFLGYIHISRVFSSYRQNNSEIYNNKIHVNLSIFFYFLKHFSNNEHSGGGVFYGVTLQIPSIL